MKHSWTGGQYSVWRALFGVSLLPTLWSVQPAWTWRLGASVLCLTLALGMRDRLAALLLAVVWGWGMRGVHPPASAGSWAVVGLMLLHAATHGSPYGALDAAGRSDPGGNWILPRWNFAARRLLLLAAVCASIARREVEIPWPVVVALVLACADPGWIPPRRERAPSRVFFDGGCGLCHRLVRMMLAEDPTGASFRFAPLRGETYDATFDAAARARHPDSVVVQTGSGVALVRSRATLHSLDRLGGLWRASAAVLRIVPTALRDSVYDFIASVRHRLFARPKTACPVLPQHLLRRFDS